METGKFYHIYSHANGSENLFRTDKNYRYFLQRYTHFIEPIADTYAYCLMPNHFHFLVCIKNAIALENTWKENHTSNEKIFDSIQHERIVIGQFSNLLNGYTQAYNKMFNRMGSLFMRSFKRKEITDDAYLTSVIIYIHKNPVHHGFVKNSGEWPWCSYNDMLNESPTILRRHEILNWFGNREEYIRAHSSTTP